MRATGKMLDEVELLVLGAHLGGQPLNAELLAHGATLVAQEQTAPLYRLWALDTTPPKPGLLRVADGGAAVTGELWRLPAAAFGTLVAGLPSPMTIGSVELADGRRRPGFLVESAATAGALDITTHGGWRQYLASLVVAQTTTTRQPMPDAAASRASVVSRVVAPSASARTT